MTKCLWCKTEFEAPIIYKERQVNCCDDLCAHDRKIFEEILMDWFPKDFYKEDFQKEFEIVFHTPDTKPQERTEKELEGSYFGFTESPMEEWDKINGWYMKKSDIIKKIMEVI